MKTLILAAASLSLAACASHPPAAPGAAVRLTLATQVLNPGAGAAAEANAGYDGKAAKAGFDAYQKSYAAPQPQPNALTIGVGGSTNR